MIFEFIECIEFCKGFYFFDVGDFLVVGIVFFKIYDVFFVSIVEVIIGENGFCCGLVVYLVEIGIGSFLIVGEMVFYDSLFDFDEDFKKFNGFVKFSCMGGIVDWNVFFSVYDFEWVFID